MRASGTPPLTYQWQRNGSNIGGATLQDYTIASAGASDNGATFRAVVSNNSGSVVSNPAVLTVSANQPPSVSITQPAAGSYYTGGMVINYAGTAMDPEDGVVPAGAYTWRVDFHHDTHMHPFVPPTTGATSGSFTIATAGETATNVWYRIYLSARDSGGLTYTTFVDIVPRVVRLTLATSPAGLQLNLDGQPVATPFSFDSVVGVLRHLEAPASQTYGGTSRPFVSWSDGGASAHDIATPSAATTYTATYGSNGTTIWRSHAVLPQSRTVPDTTGQETAAMEFYESTNDGGVNKGALLPVYTPGTHPSSSNAVSSYWSTTSGSSAYPYIRSIRSGEALAAEKPMPSRRWV